MNSWIQSNPVVFALMVAVFLNLLNGSIVWLTRPSDAAEWERIKVEAPRRAAVIIFFRSWGLDPAKMLIAIRGIVGGVLPPEISRTLPK